MVTPRLAGRLSRHWPKVRGQKECNCGFHWECDTSATDFSRRRNSVSSVLEQFQLPVAGPRTHYSLPGLAPMSRHPLKGVRRPCAVDSPGPFALVTGAHNDFCNLTCTSDKPSNCGTQRAILKCYGRDRPRSGRQGDW